MLTNKGTESCDRTTVHRIKKCLPRAPGGNLADRLGAGECNDLGNGEVYIFQKSPAYFPREGRRHIVRARIQHSYETKTHIARIVRDFNKRNSPPNPALQPLQRKVLHQRRYLLLLNASLKTNLTLSVLHPSLPALGRAFSP
jgi:hypothetical protein